jgi:putative phage-type endonuclease
MTASPSAVDVLRAVLDHVHAGGTLYGTSPLVSAAEQVIQTSETSLGNVGGPDSGNRCEGPTAPVVIQSGEALSAGGGSEEPATIRERIASGVPAAANETTGGEEPRIRSLSVREPDALIRHTLPVRPGLTAQEIALRRHTIGSSEIGAIVGVNPYQSAHQVWMAKVLGVEFEGNETARMGQLLEPTILAIYADRYDVELQRGVFTVGAEPWISCTPDAHRLDDEGGLCEAKLVGLRQLWMWGPGNSDGHESDAIPAYYLTQAYWQLEVTGAPYVDVSALLGTEFRSYRIRRNTVMQSRLVNLARDFRERYVLTSAPPPVDGSDGAREMVRALYPKSGGPAVSDSPELDEMAESLRAAREALEVAEKEKRLHENRMKFVLGDARGAHGRKWRVRYAVTKSGSRPFCFEHNDEREGV